MKKNFQICLFLIIGLMLFPSLVNAADVTVNGKRYTYSELEFVCSNVDEFFMLYATGTDDTFVYVFNPENGNKYKYFFEDSSCTAATNREIFDAQLDKTINGWKNYMIINNKIYAVNYYDWDDKRLLPAGEQLVEGALYFKGTDPVYVENPVLEEIDSYKRLYMHVLSGRYIADTDDYDYMNIAFELIAEEVGQINVDFNTIGVEYANNHAGLTYSGIKKINRVGENIFIILDFTTEENGHVYVPYNMQGQIIEELAVYNYVGKSDDEKYYLFELEEAGKNYIGLLDSNYNKIFQVEGIEFGSHYSKNDNYYIEYHTQEDLKALYFIPYSVLEGSNQQYNNNDLVVKFNGSTAFLNKIYVNNEEISSDNCTITQGSTIVTLKKAYLETLQTGDYTLKVEYKDGGFAETTFTIPVNNPQTGDEIMSSILLGTISILGILVCGLFLNKKKRYN